MAEESATVRFSGLQNLILVQCVIENDHILYGKFKGSGFGGVTAASKESCWKEIQEKVNAVAMVPKNLIQIKKRLANIKQRSQMKLDQAKKTGGGPKPASQNATEKLWLDNSSNRPSVGSLQLGLDTEEEVVQDELLAAMAGWEKSRCTFTSSRCIGPAGDNSTANSTAVAAKKTKQPSNPIPSPTLPLDCSPDVTDVTQYRHSSTVKSKNGLKRQRIQDNELKNLSLDNERLKKDIIRIEVDTEKLREETECLKLKKPLLTLKINEHSCRPEATNLLFYYLNNQKQ